MLLDLTVWAGVRPCPPRGRPRSHRCGVCHV